MNTIPCLSIKPPWSHFIIHGGKDVENRTRRTHHRGLILIHASKVPDYDRFPLYAALMFCGTPAEDVPCGGIVGVANLIDCVESHPSKWFAGPFGYVLADVKPLPFTPCRGQLGLWTPPPEVMEQIRPYL